MNRLHQALRFIFYLLASKSKHGIHSPFVYSLVTDIIHDRTPFYFFKPVELLRAQLLKNRTKINVTDLGAGSQQKVSSQRTIEDIAKNSAKSAKYGQLLFRLVNHFKPSSILELGTSLGISTLYLAGSSSTAKVITLEGCPETAAAAKENFRKMKMDHIEIMTGNFDDILPAALQKIRKADFVFFDGNHRKNPTISYFETCLSCADNNSVFIFDDIHWSGEMEEAWEKIKKHPGVTASVDLFQLGLVFFRKEQAKEDFIIRF